MTTDQQLAKASKILHNSVAPTDGTDTGAVHFVGSVDAIYAHCERRVLRNLANGIQVIGLYDNGVLVNEYHGKL